jgi:putative transposase
VKKDHPKLSVRRQCTLLSLARSTLSYQPSGESAENLKFMKIIDAQFLKTPWYGSRQMARHMQREGHKCGRRHAGSVPLARRKTADAAHAFGADLSGTQDQ